MSIEIEKTKQAPPTDTNKTIYLHIRPSTMLHKKLMEKAKIEGVDWQEIARTILKNTLLNL